jgi:xanthine/CO dehydrogenase XdhC/CoxF family maturation factor
MTCVGPVQSVRKPRDLVTDASCRTTLPPRPRPEQPSSTKDPSNDGNTITTAFQTRSAFHRRVRSARSSLALGTCASRPPLMPRLSRLGSASDTRSRAGQRARPSSLAGFRRGSQATCRSSTSAIVWTHKHNPDLSKTPPLAAVKVTARWVAPLPCGNAAS